MMKVFQVLKSSVRREQSRDNPLPIFIDSTGTHTSKPKPNGYSIAEILLVFGIIAGVLVGVWAMYEMLGGETTEQAVVAEIRMLQDAAVAYRRGSSDGSYISVRGIEELSPYLGDSTLTTGKNYFGAYVFFRPLPRGLGYDLQVTYEGIPDLDACLRILGNFGELSVTKIAPGKAKSGFISGADSSCTERLNVTYLYISID